MIQCLTTADWATRRHDILEMHRLRCRVFKGRLDWEVGSDNGLEWDRFDMLDPIYILAQDENGRVVGTWRMLPTTGPYMLRDVFPQLLDGLPAPCSPRILEGSRFAVDCEYDGSKAGLAALGRTTGEIFCAVVELSMALGAEEVVTVYDARIARLLPRLGIVPTWRGTPRQIGNTLAMAGRFDVNAEVLATVRERAGIAEPVLTQPVPRPVPALAADTHPLYARHLHLASSSRPQPPVPAAASVAHLTDVSHQRERTPALQKRAA